MSKYNGARVSQQPAIHIDRSKFGRPADYATTMNAGVLVPFYQYIGGMPSDTFDIDFSALVRSLSPLKHPVIGGAYLDVEFFAVPWRLVWEHAEEFFGATDKAWNVDSSNTTGELDVEEYFVPFRAVLDGGYKVGSIGDYMAIPTYVADAEGVSALAARAYLKVWNDYYRDGNLMDEAFMNTGDDGNDDSYSYEHAPLPVCKFHDLFTSALPYPQRGDPVTIGIASDVPVYTSTDRITNYGDYEFAPLTFSRGAGPLPTGYVFSSGASGVMQVTEAHYVNGEIDTKVSLHNPNNVRPINLFADLSKAPAVTVNDLRLALAMQRILELDSRGGTRYTSIIRSHFGVVSPDGRLQRAEYLGGKRIALNTQQVVQQSGIYAADGDALGSVGAMSKTVDRARAFVKSFTEHTILIGVMCIRVDQCYQQGLDKFWKARSRFEFYDTPLANIGEEPIFNYEVYWTGTETDKEVFGYQEPWYPYRFATNKITGYLRSNARIISQEEYNIGDPGVVSVTDANDREIHAVDVYGNPLAGSLDSWHYAAWYRSLPMLNRDWIVEDPRVIDRTLAVSSDVAHQFLIEIWNNEVDTRPMPLHSIPGIGSHF